MSLFFRVFVTGVALLFLSACGSGSSGAGNSGGGNSGPYTIGGTVSGLSGTELNLLDNGADKLTIAGNGSFTFKTSIASGGTYTATIDGEPLSPIQFCTVAHGSGTAVANVTNIQVVCTTPSEKTLYSFGDSPDGSNPQGSLVFDASGNLYGTTVEGGAYGLGTVFKLTPSQGQWTETILYSFCPHPTNQASPCPDGAVPYSGLAFDAEGNLYGTTNYGGAYGSSYVSSVINEGYSGGTVFELKPGSNGTWTESVIHSFGNGTDGMDPAAGVVFDTQGNLYGTTMSGGIAYPGVCYPGCGIVYELSPGANGQWAETVLHQFCSQTNCNDGGLPFSGLVLDSSGNLYGTASTGEGLSIGGGTVFELSPNGNGQFTYNTLYQFPGVFQDGDNPRAGVILDSSGNLYGATENGGTSGNNGTAFELTKEQGAQWKENILYEFCELPLCADGGGPQAGLVFDKAGNLYGAAGAVFALTPGAAGGPWNEVALYTFSGGSDGAGPVANLIFDTDGNLYGTSQSEGNKGGAVVEVTP